MKRVGIFSGTFDPVHNGHVDFARAALKEGKLDKVFFLVEPRPRRKQGVKALEHRTAMVELALKDQAKLGTIILQQARFSVSDTLPILQRRFEGAELYFLAGDDIIKHFNDQQWPNVDDFIRSVHFLIGLREHQLQEVSDQIKTLEKVRGVTLRHQLFTAPDQTIASRHIRASIRAGHQPRAIAKEVLKYIKQHNLYALSDE